MGIRTCSVLHLAVTSGTELTPNSTNLARFMAIAVLTVTGVACTSSQAQPATGATSDPTSTAPSSAPPAPSSAAGIRPAGDGLAIEITRVSDGDSLRAESAEGELEIRLLGINAPERDACFSTESTAELERLLSTGAAVLHPWPGETDQFGRQLGLLVSNEVFVNLSLIETGHVIARAQSDHGFDAEFEEAEAQASAARRGLWAADACGEPNEAELKIVEIEEDPPGDDRMNPNGEWVIIENFGGPVSMEGWRLRDESTRHRYDFPAVTVAEGGSIQIFVGCGDDTTAGLELELYWCDPEPPVWNNGGDTAFLLDPNGAIADSSGTED